MKLLTSKNLLASCGVATAMLIGCGDDTSSNFADDGFTALPDTLESFVDLQNYTCGAAQKCKGVYVMDMGYGVCDGKGGWVYGSLIENMGCEEEKETNPEGNGATTLPDTVESFVDLLGNSCGAANKCKIVVTMDMGYGVCNGEGGWVYGSLIHDMDCGIDYVPGYDEPPVSSSSIVAVLSSSSEVVESSSSSGPKYEIRETCTTVDPCEGMDRTDVSTWHFTRKDAFGDPAEYTYTAEGDELHLTIVHADGQSNTQILTMYKMTTEVGKEMAFSAARSTCRDGNDGDAGEQVCVSDTVLVAN